MRGNGCVNCYYCICGYDSFRFMGFMFPSVLPLSSVTEIVVVGMIVLRLSLVLSLPVVVYVRLFSISFVC